MKSWVFTRNLGEIESVGYQRFVLLQRQTQFYRQLHLLIKLFNECFRDDVLPTIFVTHAGMSIICLFVVIELRQFISGVVFIIYTFIMVMVVVFDVIMMEYASKPISFSKCIKQQWSKCQVVEGNCWLKRFSRSCPILRLYIKPSLSIGRERLAAFIKFCLQRTLFFVVLHRNSHV